MGLDLHPENFSSGGFFTEGVYRFTGTHFRSWDYDGKSPNPAMGLWTTLVSAEDGHKDERFWSVGPAKSWSCSDDGQELLPLGTSRAINENANFAQLHGSLLKASYPTERMHTDRVGDIYDGMLAYLINQKAPSREGMEAREPRLNPQTGQPYPQRDPEVVVVAEIKEWPWEVDAGLKVADGAPQATPQGPSARPQAASPAARGRAGAAAAGPASRQAGLPPTLPPAAPAAPAIPESPPVTQAEHEATVEASANGASADGAESPDELALSLVYEAIANAGGPVERGSLMQLAMGRFRGSPNQPRVMGHLANMAAWQQWEQQGLVELLEGGTKVGVPG